MIAPSLAKQKPLPVSYGRGGWKGIHVDITARASGLLGSLRDTLVATVAFRRVVAGTETNNAPEDEKMEMNTVANTVVSDRVNAKSSKQRQARPTIEPMAPEKVMEWLNPRKRRIDFVLQERMLENPFLSALSVHMNYWKELDVAMFILRELLEINA